MLAANRLHQTNYYDKALDAYTKALKLVRDDREALRGLLESLANHLYEVSV